MARIDKIATPKMMGSGWMSSYGGFDYFGEKKMNMAEDRTFLHRQLDRSVSDFLSLVEPLSAAAFERNPGGKWSAGQDLAHLVKTLRVIRIGLMVPPGVFRLFLGSPNRPSRPYDQFSARYKEKMSAGIQAPAYVLPPKVGFADRQQLIGQIKDLNERIIRKMNSLEERTLDHYIVPHPLFGKITLREFFMAIWLHTDHHTALLQKKLEIPG